MMHSMGYVLEDSEKLHKLIQVEVEDKFLQGKYELKELNEHGQHFTTYFTLRGKNDHVGEKFNCHVGCVAWHTAKSR